MIGYPEIRINGVIVKPNQENKLDVQMQAELILICCFGPIYCPQIIEMDNTTSGTTLNNVDIQNSPFRNVNDLIISTPCVSPASY